MALFLADLIIAVFIKHLEQEGSLHPRNLAGDTEQLEGIIDQAGQLVLVKHAGVVPIVAHEGQAECLLNNELLHLAEHPMYNI